MRISFTGGGSDLRDFYSKHGGVVVSTAINKYVYIIVNKRFDNTIRVSYSKTEIVDKVEDIQHPIVREALKLVGIDRGIEIVSIADVPSSTGLGSSSAFTVGLLNALYAYKGVLKSAEELAKLACHIEIDVLGEPIGKQDQYICATGGFRYIQFNPDDTVTVEYILYDKKEELNRNLLLVYTGNTHEKSSFLVEQKANIGDKVAILSEMKGFARDLRDLLSKNYLPEVLAPFLDKDWQFKKQLAGCISNKEIDGYYEKALDAGAFGGKMCGAGGFMLLYCPLKRQAKVREALSNLTFMDFKFELEGSRVIYVNH